MGEITTIKLTPTELAIVKFFLEEEICLEATLDQILIKSNHYLTRKVQKNTLKNLLQRTSNLLSLGFVVQKGSGIYSFDHEAYSTNQALYKYYQKFKGQVWFQYLLAVGDDNNPVHLHGIELYSGGCKNKTPKGKRTGECRLICQCHFSIPRIDYSTINIPPSNNSQKIFTQINQYGTTRFVYYPNGAMSITYKGIDSNNNKKALTIIEFEEWLNFCNSEILSHTQIPIESREFFILKISLGKDIDTEPIDLPSLKGTNLRLHDVMGSQYELYTYAQDQKIRLAIQENCQEEITIDEFLREPSQISILSGIKTIDHKIKKINQIEAITKENSDSQKQQAKQLHFMVKMVKDIAGKNLPILSDSINDLKEEINNLKHNNRPTQTPHLQNELKSITREFDIFRNQFTSVMDNVEINQIEDGENIHLIADHISNIGQEIEQIQITNSLIIDKHSNIEHKLNKMGRILLQIAPEIINIGERQAKQQDNIENMIQIMLNEQKGQQMIHNEHTQIQNKILETQNQILSEILDSKTSIFQKIKNKIKKSR